MKKRLRKTRKPYVIDEVTILPDLLNEKKLYIDKNTKELHEFNSYDIAFQQFIGTADYNIIKDLQEIPNTKAARLLFSSNRHRLPKGNSND